MNEAERERIRAAGRKRAKEMVAEGGPIPEHILRDLARDLLAAQRRDDSQPTG